MKPSKASHNVQELQKNMVTEQDNNEIASMYNRATPQPSTAGPCISEQQSSATTQCSITLTSTVTSSPTTSLSIPYDVGLLDTTAPLTTKLLCDTLSSTISSSQSRLPVHQFQVPQLRALRVITCDDNWIKFAEKVKSPKESSEDATVKIDTSTTTRKETKEVYVCCPRGSKTCCKFRNKKAVDAAAGTETACKCISAGSVNANASYAKPKSTAENPLARNSSTKDSSKPPQTSDATLNTKSYEKEGITHKSTAENPLARSSFTKNSYKPPLTSDVTLNTKSYEKEGITQSHSSRNKTENIDSSAKASMKPKKKSQDTNSTVPKGFKINSDITAVLYKSTFDSSMAPGNMKFAPVAPSDQDKAVQFPEPEEVEDELSEDYDIWTGMMADGKRRVDYVLVVDLTLGDEVREAQLKYLVSLVKLGLVIEIEDGVLERHQHLQFIKIHAPDSVLYEYAEVFRVRKMFRDNHVQYIHSEKGTFNYTRFGYLYERECLLKLRKRYDAPLLLSTLDRSYVVYLLLRCQPFGEPANHCGLQRLLDNDILKDAYALHDGSYFIEKQNNYKKFNCRQILYFYWAGFDNVLRYQPLNLIHEYYGSRLAFYFTFYEFYNKALAVASIWGLFMTVIYFIKDNEHLGETRSKVCAMDFNPKDPKTWQLQGPECLGVGRDHRCPVKPIRDQCIDMHILKFIDSPYVIIYSIGISLWATLFLLFWKRVEYYWMWMWEEGHLPDHRILRPEAEPRYLNWPDKLNKTFTDRFETYADRFEGCMLRLFRRFVAGIMLPSLGLITLLILMCCFIFGYVEWVRPFSVTERKISEEHSMKIYKYLKKVNRSLDYVILTFGVFLVSIMFLEFEKCFHDLSLLATKLENFKTYSNFEKRLILHCFSFSFVYGTALVVYFAWLKGLLYVSPIEVTEIIINLTTPWKDYSVNMTKVSPALRNISMRLTTWNCGGTLSCLREAVIVYCVIIALRIVVLTVGENIFLFLKSSMNKPEVKSDQTVPTVEREYMLQSVTEDIIRRNFNELVFQFALIALFTPLLPLAPLVAFLVNVWDLRFKAKQYVTVSRRIVVFRSRGIGCWSKLVKLICYATPFYHALTITQTQLFRKYAFYKNFYNKKNHTSFSNYFHGLNTIINLGRYAERSETEIADKRSYDMMPYYWDGKINELHYPAGEDNQRILMFGFHQDVAITNYAGVGLDYIWPYAWNYLEDNRTYSYFSSEHYMMKFTKVLFVMIFMHVFALLSLAIWSCAWSRPTRVRRLALRERRARRVHYMQGAPPHVKLNLNPPYLAPELRT